jgi:RNA polymerase sigma factor (TIGR02999 family)
VQWHDRAHFLAMASRLMRRILVDYWRKKHAYKRGGEHQRVDLDETLLMSQVRPETVLDLDDALKRLEKLNPRQSEAVEYRYFGGMTSEETAAVLGVSRATVERDLRAARAWLAREWDKQRSN